MEHVNTIPLLVVLLSVVTAGVTDLWKFKVHNLLTLPLLASGLAYHGLLEGVADGAGGLTYSLAGAAFGFAILFVPYLMGGMGAGDVKLMAGLGAWLGMPATLYVFIASGLATGVYALALIVRHGGFREAYARLQIACLQMTTIAKHLGPDERIETAVHRDDRRRRLIPFAAMVLFGVVAVLVHSQWQ